MKIVREMIVSGTDRALELTLWSIQHRRNSIELSHEIELSLSDTVSVTFRNKDQVNNLIKFLVENKIFLK